MHDRDQDALLDVLARMRTLADAHDAVLVGETLDERFRYDEAARFVGTGKLHLAFHFALLHSRWRADRLTDAIDSWVCSLPEDGWPTWVLSNHDFKRHPTRWGGGDVRAKAAATLALTLRGTPFLYYGEELGMPEASLTRAQIVDPPGKRFWPFFKGRDGARTPMQWTAGPRAGFTTGTPWLPLQPDAAQRNVAVQREDPDSVWNAYRQLLALRRRAPALTRGDLTLQRRAGLVAYTRSCPDQTLQVALNPGRGARSLETGTVRTLWSTHGADHTGPTVQLAPDEAVVLELL